jgi:hypothetical protein
MVTNTDKLKMLYNVAFFELQWKCRHVGKWRLLVSNRNNNKMAKVAEVYS